MKVGTGQSHAIAGLSAESNAEVKLKPTGLANTKSYQRGTGLG